MIAEEILSSKDSPKRDEAKEISLQIPKGGNVLPSKDLPDRIKRRAAASYKELEARQNRVKDLERLYMDMALQKELQKKGKKRKLREDEIVSSTSRSVYKWRQERKRRRGNQDLFMMV